jgi:RNA polymerase sigma-70 factor (family 1)
LYTLSSHTEKGLLLLLSDNNEAAFTEIYERFWDKLFCIAANKLNSPDDAEGLVQDIFLDLWNRRSSLSINSLEAYLATAVKYKVINILAKRSRDRRFLDQASLQYTVEDDCTEQWISFEELKDSLTRLVAALPEKCRMVFQLSRDNGFSQKEIAAQLGIAEKTVESHLSRALRTLRSELKNFIPFL